MAGRATKMPRLSHDLTRRKFAIITRIVIIIDAVQGAGRFEFCVRVCGRTPSDSPENVRIAERVGLLDHISPLCALPVLLPRPRLTKVGPAGHKLPADLCSAGGAGALSSCPEGVCWQSNP